MRRRGLLAAGGAVALAVSAAAAGAGAITPTPAAIRSATLRQDGQLLDWRVTFAAPLAATSLTSAGNTLCLQITPTSGGRGQGRACVVSRSTGRAKLQLVLTAPGPGGAEHQTVVPATFSRQGASELTTRFTPNALDSSYRPIRWQAVSSAAGCQAGTSCTSSYPSTPALLKLHRPRLVGCAPRGPAFVTGGSAHRREVALTFDDGPWPDTPQFLRILQRDHVHATFFQIGDQVATYGRGIDRKILADGDMIGDHTWNHADIAGGGSFAAGELAQARAAISKLTGFTPCLFRAPYGAVSPALISLARRMGFTTIQWDVDPRDWSRPGVGAIYSTVVDNVHNGSIVIQHDGGGDRSETLAALPHEIATLRRRGYHLVTITQLLGQRLIYR